MLPIDEEIASLYRFLHDEVAWIHYRVKVFRQLFESGSEVHDILRWASGWVFWLFYRDLLDGIVLSLARLTDPPEQGRGRQYENASLEFLINKLKRTEPDTTIRNWWRHLNEMRIYCLGIHTWRSKVAAHRDAATITRPPAFEVISFEKSDLENALVELRSFMNELQTACAGRYGIAQPFDYTFPPPFDDGETLISVLKIALASYTPPPPDTSLLKIPTA